MANNGFNGRLKNTLDSLFSLVKTKHHIIVAWVYRHQNVISRMAFSVRKGMMPKKNEKTKKHDQLDYITMVVIPIMVGCYPYY